MSEKTRELKELSIKLKELSDMMDAQEQKMEIMTTLLLLMVQDLKEENKGNK